MIGRVGPGALQELACGVSGDFWTRQNLECGAQTISGGLGRVWIAESD